MSIAVSGTRERLTKSERQLVRTEVVRVEPTGHVGMGMTVHVGDCPTGVDAFIREIWPGIIRKDFEADWYGVGAVAGPERNGRMLVGVNKLLAFPGPKSKGTLDAIKQAIALGIETHIFPLGRR